MIYLELFWSFFQIGLFSIGGGYAAMPLIQDQVVDIHPWLTMTGFADIMAIAEMTPGPIALNAATFVGIQVAGLPGALIATIGCIFPSCVIVMTLAYVYYRFRGLSIVQGVLAGLRPAVIAMIASAGISLMILALYGQRTLPADLSSFDLMALVIFLAGFFVLRKWKPSPIKVMAGGRRGMGAVPAAVAHHPIRLAGLHHRHLQRPHYRVLRLWPQLALHRSVSGGGGSGGLVSSGKYPAPSPRNGEKIQVARQPHGGQGSA